MVEVRHDEGVASRIGPEPCVGVREAVGEASVGERAGQVSYHDLTSRLGRAPRLRGADRRGNEAAGFGCPVCEERPLSPAQSWRHLNKFQLNNRNLHR